MRRGDLAVSQGLADAAAELYESDDLSVMVVTGAGGNFCAGMDLGAFAAGETGSIPGRGMGFTERPPRKPVIAAEVEGYALAGGTEVVLAADLVVASRTAKFGIPEVNRGLVAAGGGLLRLPRRIPYQKALELAMAGDSFTEEQGAQRGFVNTVTEPGEALDGALDLAARIMANGPLAVAVTKQVLVKSVSWSETKCGGSNSNSSSPCSRLTTPRRARLRSRRNARRTGPDPDGRDALRWTSDSTTRPRWWSAVEAAWALPPQAAWPTTAHGSR